MKQWEEGWECPECGLKRGPDLVDPCLGVLPGVKYACCGHGSKGDIGLELPAGYIYFENGRVIRFQQVTESQLKDGPYALKRDF